MSGVTTTKRFETFSKSFTAPNQFFSYFQRPPYISGQDPYKISGFMSSHLSSVPLKTIQWVPSHAGIPGNKHTDSLPKAGGSQPTAKVPCSSPQLSPNPLHPVPQMETSHSPSILTVPFLQFIRRIWSSYAPYAFELSAFASIVKAFYYCRKSVVRKENSFGSAYRHLLQNLNHLFFV